MLSEFLVLVKNREAIDTRSEMPLYHMSYIIQALVREENMLGVLGSEKESYQNRGHVCRSFIGSRVEKLKVCLQHLSGDDYMGMDCCTKGYLSLCEYRSVEIRNNILAVPSAEEARNIDVIMIETEPIRPGYLRLQTLCPQLHKGQTYWLNETTALLKYTRAKQTEYKGDIIHKGIKSREWPEAAAEWVSRERPSGWPGKHVIESAVEGGCLVISRSHGLSRQREVEWQLIFPHVETVIATEALTAAQRYCLCVFKILVDFHLREISIRLKTTTFKTIVYFACEVLPIDAWELNISGCLMYLLDKLYFHLSKKWLPNYFIKSNNMYDHLSKYEPLAQAIDNIRSYPIMATFFLVDHHDLVHLWMFDDIIDNIEVYRNHRDARRSYHDVFLPDLLKLAHNYMLNEWYRTAGTVLHAAYQEILAVAEEHEDIPTFQDFLKKVLATEDIDDRRHMYRHMDRQYGTTLQKRGRIAEQMTSYKDIEGIGHLEQFRDEPIPQSYIGDNVLEILYILPHAKRLKEKNGFADAVCLLQAIIKKARQFKEGFMVPDIIDDPNLEREMIKQTEMPRSLTNISLLVSYGILFKCLSSLHEEDHFKEHIKDYEDICYELDYYEELKEVANIWERFGDKERARTLREEATRCKREQTEKIAKTALSILSGSAGTDIDELVSNLSAIDILSLIPMAHLSHIVKIMIQERFLLTFPGDNAVFQYDLKRDEDDPNFRMTHFGSTVEEFATTMSNFSPNRNRSILPPIPKMIIYDIRDSLANLEMADESKDRNILYTAENQHSLPGYVRIKIDILGDQAFAKQGQTKISEYKLHSQPLDRNRKLFTGIRCPVWPDEAKEWLTRERPAKWPNEEILGLAKEDECFLIGRPHPQSKYPDADWQWVFPTTEIRIAREALSDEQKYCFRVFKILVDFHTRNLPVRLTTTHLKTVMYTTCEILSADHWKVNPGGCLLFLLDRLVVCLRIGVLPNYFIPANNMIDHFSKGHLCALRQRLYAVRVFPISALFIVVDHHGLFGVSFLDRTLQDIVKFRKHQNLYRSTEECFLRDHSNYFRALVLTLQFKNAKRQLEDAFLAKTGKLPYENVLRENDSFEKFCLDVTGDEFGELKGLVAYEMDNVCECDFTRLLHCSSEFVHLKDILDVKDCLEYSEVPIQRNSVNSRYKELMFLESLSLHFTSQRLYQKAAHFLRCGIHKTSQAIQYSNKETKQQNTELSSEAERVENAERSLYNYALLRFYHDLYCAYKSMGQTELMQEYIEDYEAVCMTCGYTFHYNRVANIWQKLGNRVRAESLRDQAEYLSSSQKRCPNVSRYDSFDDVD